MNPLTDTGIAGPGSARGGWEETDEYEYEYQDEYDCRPVLLLHLLLLLLDLFLPRSARPHSIVPLCGTVMSADSATLLGAVWIRQGVISCGVSEEVYQMGIADAHAEAPRTPVLTLEFSDMQRRERLGQAHSLSTIFHERHGELPDAQPRGSSMLDYFDRANRNYWRELAAHIEFRRLLKPVTFAVSNVLRGRAKREGGDGTATRGWACRA